MGKLKKTYQLKYAEPYNKAEKPSKNLKCILADEAKVTEIELMEIGKGTYNGKEVEYQILRVILEFD